ncbi:MAG: PaaI family thioesterase [Candidatus Competibacteraceae bacterium]|nr:PaaI family thioesterase [Candidatus Competibacteraceae bacterium]
MTENNTRTRTITWEDPALSTQSGRSLTGLDYLIAVKDGKLPISPFGRLLDYRIAEVRTGHAVLELEPEAYHCNPTGRVHGGVVSSVLDSAMGCAVQSTLERGVGYATLEIKVNFVRPLASQIPRVRCEAKTLHVGSRIITTEGKLCDGRGKLYAHATATFMLFQP